MKRPILPALMPVGLLYDNPENAAAEIRFLKARGYPVHVSRHDLITFRCGRLGPQHASRQLANPFMRDLDEERLGSAAMAPRGLKANWAESIRRNGQGTPRTKQTLKSFCLLKSGL